jgi:glycine/D-amino acid oxidase-like deaminating enzyme
VSADKWLTEVRVASGDVEARTIVVCA